MYAWTTIININMLLTLLLLLVVPCISVQFSCFLGANFSFTLPHSVPYYTLCLWCSYRDAIHHITVPRIAYFSRLFHPSERARQSTSEKKVHNLSASAFISRWPNFVPSIFQWRQHKVLKDSPALAHTYAVTCIPSLWMLAYVFLFVRWCCH